MSYSIIDHLVTCEVGFISLAETLDRYIMYNRDVLSRTRRRDIVDKRSYLSFIYCTECGLTREQVGRKLGLDHSTITHCVVRHEALKKDKSYNYNIKEIKQLVKEYLK